MTTMRIDFVWKKDSKGYEFVPGRHGGQIRRRGGRLEEIRPLDFHTSLYAHFASLGDEPAEFVKFMNTFGPITGRHEGDRDAETVAVLIGYRGRMTENLRRWKENPQLLLYGNNESNVSALTAVFRPAPPDGRIVMHLVPETLLDAMLLQFGQAVSSGKDVRECDWCRSWFETGGGGKRTIARFCSDKCRTHFHNEMKKNGVK